ncbi:MAG: hypothetical protein ACQES0_09365 [Bacteroidota bacterium]
MRKALLLLCALILVMNGSAQLVSYNIDASKTYENGTKTVYLTLEGEITGQLRSEFEREFKTRSSVSMFRYYDAENPAKCMYTADESFGETELDQIISNVNASLEYVDEPRQDRRNTEYKKYQLVIPEGKEARRTAIKLLMSFDYIDYASFGEGNICKLGVRKNTDMKDIQKAFKAAGLNLIE